MRPKKQQPSALFIWRIVQQFNYRYKFLVYLVLSTLVLGHFIKFLTMCHANIPSKFNTWPLLPTHFIYCLFIWVGMSLSFCGFFISNSNINSRYMSTFFSCISSTRFCWYVCFFVVLVVLLHTFIYIHNTQVWTSKVCWKLLLNFRIGHKFVALTMFTKPNEIINCGVEKKMWSTENEHGNKMFYMQLPIN